MQNEHQLTEPESLQIITEMISYLLYGIIAVKGQLKLIVRRL
jgi:hypothetical protein